MCTVCGHLGRAGDAKMPPPRALREGGESLYGCITKESNFAGAKPGGFTDRALSVGV